MSQTIAHRNSLDACLTPEGKRLFGVAAMQRSVQHAFLHGCEMDRVAGLVTGVGEAFAALCKTFRVDADFDRERYRQTICNEHAKRFLTEVEGDLF